MHIPRLHPFLSHVLLLKICFFFGAVRAAPAHHPQRARRRQAKKRRGQDERDDPSPLLSSFLFLSFFVVVSLASLSLFVYLPTEHIFFFFFESRTTNLLGFSSPGYSQMATQWMCGLCVKQGVCVNLLNAQPPLVRVCVIKIISPLHLPLP